MAARKKPSPLAAPLAALEAKDLPKTLSELLRAWREVPATELAEVIDEASRACRSLQPALGGKRGRERAAQWEALAAQKKPEDLERLFEDLITNTAAESALRIRRVAADHPRDPRIARWLAGLVSNAPFTSENAATFWTMVAETLVEIADPRSLGARLAYWSLRRGRKLEKAHERIAEKYPEGAPTLPEESRATLTRIRSLLAAYAPAPKTKKSVADGAALLQAVYDAPGDDSKRLVYADWLSEQGDPRGEFILLQFKRRDGNAPKGSAARERDLLTEHWQEWLGALKYLPRKGLVFERGFLDTARPSSAPLATDPNAIEWSTCATVDLADSRLTGIGMARFTASPHLRSLRRVLGLRPESGYGENASDLAKSPLAPRLEVVGFKTDVHPRDRARPSVGDLSGFTGLKEVWWFDRYHPLDGLPSVLGNPVAERLQAFRAENDYGDEFALTRGGSGRLSVLRISLKKKWVDQAAQALAALAPGTLDELHVTAGVKLDENSRLEALVAQAERLKPGIVQLPSR